MSEALVSALRHEFGEAVLGSESRFGDESVRIAPEQVVPVLRHLRDRESCELLLDVVGNHFPERDDPFEVTYLLRS
ncbi:MAG: hypothetical protein KC729_21500, partial [Candidatus Eisenbacteria bacterium]|nr:hypothetical protein [Candidatus Eisenbacteria bacterium]